MESMRYIKLSLTLLCLVLLVPAATHAQTEKAMRLEDYTWKNRVLLVFAPTGNNPNFTEQLDFVAKETRGIQERDLVVLELSPSSRQARQRAALLAQFGVDEHAYTLILLGKDGQEKFRSTKPVPMPDIFGIIDQMPMRRQEMRKQDKKQ
jgi:hypothetical protein